MGSLQKSRWLMLSVVVGALCLVHTALAEKPKPAVAAPVNAASAPAPKKLGPPPDKATNAKVNAYIEFINEESGPFNGVRRTWLTRIDRKVGPTCKENLSIEQTIGPDYGRYDAYRKKLKAKPALPADAAALRMVDAVEELRKLGNEPGPYNEYQGQKEPGSWCKKLKETFPRLLAMFDKFSQGEAEVRDYVDKFTDERDLRETETTLKKYGKHYRYQFAVLTLEGKMMLRTIGAELAKDSPDAGLIKQKFDSYFALADETKAMMDKEPPNQKTEPFPHTFMFLMVESVPKIKRGSESLLEALGRKHDKKWGEWVESGWRQVVGGYNDLVTYANQVSFENKQK